MVVTYDHVCSLPVVILLASTSGNPSNPVNKSAVISVISRTEVELFVCESNKNVRDCVQKFSTLFWAFDTANRSSVSMFSTVFNKVFTCVISVQSVAPNAKLYNLKFLYWWVGYYKYTSYSF